MNKIRVIFIVFFFIISILPIINSSNESTKFNNNFYQNLDAKIKFKAELELLKIRNEIKKNNADWIADYTSMSNPTNDNENIVLGCIPEDVNDNEYENILYTGQIPDVYDWRYTNGVDFTTKIKDQGSCGSCVAFGTIAALESVVQIDVGQPFECDLSEADIFFCGGGKCDGGWQTSKALNYLKNKGVSDELCFPYRQYQVSCSEKCLNCEDRSVRIRYWGWLSSSVYNIRNALVKYGPLVTSIKVYNDFYSYNGGVYKHVTGDFEGWHCVAIVGFDDINGYWICKNSWGTGWGENGWFKIEYGQCKIEDDTAYISGISGNIHPSKPSNPTPSDNEYNINPEVNLSWSECVDFNDDEIFYNVYLDEGTFHYNNIVAEHINKTFFNIENLEKDSIYSWMVVAEDENGAQSTSTIWQFRTRLPSKPIVEGLFNGSVRNQYFFNASTTDDDGLEYFWFFNWGDDTNTGWLGPYGPGEVVSVEHSWSRRGNYDAWARYKEDSIMSERTILEISMSKNKNPIDLFIESFQIFKYLFSRF